MGIDISLETETGEILEQVFDPKNILEQVLPSYDDMSFYCLRFIDPYGDTVFNQLQMVLLLAELRRIREKVQNQEESAFLDQIETLANRCKAGPHLYLKFYGD
jgi:hypothetical protein